MIERGQTDKRDPSALMAFRSIAFFTNKKQADFTLQVKVYFWGCLTPSYNTMVLSVMCLHECNSLTNTLVSSTAIYIHLRFIHVYDFSLCLAILETSTRRPSFLFKCSRRDCSLALPSNWLRVWLQYKARIWYLLL